MHSERVSVPVDGIDMDGMLWVPGEPAGVVLFAHCGAGNRVKPPTDYVASVLRDARLATLWLDLLTAEELRSHSVRNDIALLCDRLQAGCDWVRKCDAADGLPLGLFGVGAGAAAALQFAAAHGRRISAIVTRSGRTDLAAAGMLGKVSAPTLLIAGELDDGAVAINRAAYAALRCKKKFEIVPGAPPSFAEAGNLEVVARLARAWFLQHVSAAAARPL